MDFRSQITEDHKILLFWLVSTGQVLKLVGMDTQQLIMINIVLRGVRMIISSKLQPLSSMELRQNFDNDS